MKKLALLAVGAILAVVLSSCCCGTCDGDSSKCSAGGAKEKAPAEKAK